MNVNISPTNWAMSTAPDSAVAPLKPCSEPSDLTSRIASIGDSFCARFNCAPVGVDAFQALASRALSLAKSQYQKLSAVHVTANGCLGGLDKIEFRSDANENDKVGIILISQLLGLVLLLLGEAATVRLIEGMPVQNEVTVKVDKPGTSQMAAGTSYFGPFQDILLEADQLRNVSERLEILMDKHTGIEQLASVTGSIRNIAAVLDVFTLIRSKTGTSQGDAPVAPNNGYID